MCVLEMAYEVRPRRSENLVFMKIRGLQVLVQVLKQLGDEGSERAYEQSLVLCALVRMAKHLLNLSSPRLASEHRSESAFFRGHPPRLYHIQQQRRRCTSQQSTAVEGTDEIKRQIPYQCHGRSYH
jgi:hypothetical protein